MADQSIALYANPNPPSYSPASALQAVNQFESGQITNATGQTQLEMLKRQSSGQDIQFRNQLIRDAAAHAQDADSWDKAMQAAASRGAPEATQYIGRYTPLLQQRLFDAYNGQPATAAPSAVAPAGGTASVGRGGTVASNLTSVGPPTDQYDRAFQNVTPQQMQQSLRNLNMVNDALMTVRDPQSWDAAVQKLVAAGIPQAQQFAGSYSPLRVQQLWQSIQPVRSYLQNRVGSESMGLPNPMIPRTIEKTPEGLFEYNPYGAPGTPANPIATKKEFIGVDKTGDLSAGVFDAATGTFTNLGGQQGVSPFTAFAAKMNKAENATGNPAAQNPRSSATGNGQFINSTWLDLMKSTRPTLIKGMTDQQILGLRNDPKLSEEMTAAYAQNNAATLSAAGLQVTTASLALAHRFGAEGAQKILTAAPGTKLSDIFSAEVMKANPGLVGMTAGQYAQGMASQFGNTPMNTEAPTGDMHGNDYLATLSPTMSSLVKSYAEGRQAFPSGFALKSPYFQNLIKMVAQYDPNFDAVNYNARAKTRSDFTSGKSSTTINAMNTALGHLNMIDAAGDALNNRDVPAWNYVTNALGTAFGQAAPGNFKAAAGLVSEELTRVYRQAGGSEKDIERHLADLSVNASPAQRRGALYTIGELLKSKLDAMGEQYNQGMGTTHDPLRLLNLPAQTAFNKLLAYGPKGTGHPSTQPGVAGTVATPGSNFVNGRVYQDQNGNKAKYQDGQWIPVPGAAATAVPGAT